MLRRASRIDASHLASCSRPIRPPSPVVNMPATQAVISVASVAARRARHPSPANSSRREGINAAIPPTKMATDRHGRTHTRRS